MKAYTDIEQSKILAKILPIVSSDMWYSRYGHPGYNPVIAYNEEQWFLCQIRNSYHNDIPCWSLAALLNVIPEPSLIQNQEGSWMVQSWNKKRYPRSVGGYINPVDACVDMIVKLKEKNMI